MERMGNVDTETVLQKLDEILANQEEQKEVFEIFQETVLEKLDNVGLPGGDFEVEFAN